VMNNRVVGVPKVRQEAERKRAAADGEAHRVRSVMGYGKGGDLECTEGKTTPSRKNAPIGSGIAPVLPANLFGGQSRGVDRALQGAQQDGQSPGMVPMFVGEENGGNFAGVDAGQGEALKGFPRAQSRVEKDSLSFCPQDRGVSAAPTAKDDKFHIAQANDTVGLGQTASAFRSWPKRLLLS